jgi:hypothetical protein
MMACPNADRIVKHPNKYAATQENCNRDCLSAVGMPSGVQNEQKQRAERQKACRKFDAPDQWAKRKTSFFLLTRPS